MDRSHTAAHTFWTWVWILCFPAALLLGIFVKWWAGLVALVLGFMLFGAIKDSAAKFVMDQALAREEFYNAAIQYGALRISPV